MRMFSSTLRRNTSIRSFYYLKKRLLNAFSGNISCDRYILALFCDLVYLIYIDDAKFCSLYIIIRCLYEL